MEVVGLVVTGTATLLDCGCGGLEVVGLVVKGEYAGFECGCGGLEVVGLVLTGAAGRLDCRGRGLEGLVGPGGRFIGVEQTTQTFCQREIGPSPHP